MRDPTSYARIFGADTPLEVWPHLVDVFKRCDDALESMRPTNSPTDRFVAKRRSHLALVAVARALESFAYGTEGFIALDKRSLTREMLIDTWKRGRGADYGHAAAVFHISGLQRVQLGDIPKFGGRAHERAQLVNRVESKLPPQPWRVGIHIEVARQLDVTPEQVQSAIKRLIAQGKVLPQRDGVVYDKEGNVVAVDPERSNPSTA